MACAACIVALIAATSSPRALASSSKDSSGTTLKGLATWFRQQHEEWQWHESRWLRRLDRAGRPPTGAVYMATVKMPVIGSQTFMLRLTGRNRCQIVLSGPLSLNEPASFTEEHNDVDTVVTLVMNFNDPTLELLRRWRTRIKATTWHRDGDYAMLVVAAPLIPPIRIRMPRADGERRA